MKIKIINFGVTENHMPRRAHDNDAGADVYAPYGKIIYPGETVKFPLGFGLELPDGFTGFVFPRSSLSAKGIVCQLPPIDSGYRGEIHAVVTNTGTAAYTIEPDDRIGQLVILPVVIADFVQTKDERGQGAFGSSGR